jgi:flagellar L-ring protein precursor FlgH
LEESVVYDHVVRPEKIHEGSLWRNNGTLSELFLIPKARKIGDIVTIKIIETAKATNSADTSSGRDSSLTAGIEEMLGLEKLYAKEFAKQARYFNPFGKTAVKGSLSSGFKGAGETTRSGDLQAYITARVSAVLPNGNLKIIGSREIMVNEENQIITLTGIIRPRDVSPENVVLSTYISDARIKYSGTGIVNDRQNPGWLSNVLNAVWPF